MYQVETGSPIVIDFYSLWPPFLCTSLLLWGISRPAFALLDKPPAAHPLQHRLRTIDGLRGFLALGVVFHHVAVLHVYLKSGSLLPATWVPPPVRFYALIGPMGVSLFFMITGFLFWSRLIDQRGKSGWLPLYVGRIFRIGPLYLAAAGGAILLDHWARIDYIARASGASPSPGKQLLSLILLGLSVYPDPNKFLAGVTWSIQYEWFFYASLPFLALILHLPRLQRWLIAGVFASCLLIRTHQHSLPAGTRTAPMMVALFCVGMMCASLRRVEFRRGVPEWLASTAVLTFLAAVLCFRDVYTPGPVLLMAGAFYLITSGCTVFGLLTLRPAIRLGDVSYGIYLLQGFSLALCFRPAILRTLSLTSPWYYWCLTYTAVVLLVLLSTVTYVVIERPGIKLGREIAKKCASYGISSVTRAELRS